ncbi:SMR family transporter (plasmid) [Escherichia coli]|uniref:DMT family transporter n=1 Tax=Escherichia coli TaxID=562 RepID=UPI0021BE4F5A|nr:SMR family transporter [Escherichia coli]
MHNKPYTNWEIYHERLAFLVIAIVGEVIATSALKSSEGFTKLAPSAVVIIGYGIAFYFPFSGSEIHPCRCCLCSLVGTSASS